VVYVVGNKDLTFPDVVVSIGVKPILRFVGMTADTTTVVGIGISIVDGANTRVVV